MGTVLDSKTPLVMVARDNNCLTATERMESCLYAKDIASEDFHNL